MTHPWIINGIHNPIQPNLVDMELQKLSSEVSSCSFINVSVEVGGGFFSRGANCWEFGGEVLSSKSRYGKNVYN